MALAPFSQNSNLWRLPSGDGHAQLWQSKPVFWLTVVNTRTVSRGPSFSNATLNDSAIAGSPADECDGCRIVTSCFSIGGWARIARSCPSAVAVQARPTASRTAGVVWAVEAG